MGTQKNRLIENVLILMDKKLFTLCTLVGPDKDSFYAPNFEKVEGAYCIFTGYCPFQIKFCKQDISKSITARSFKLSQPIEDNE